AAGMSSHPGVVGLSMNFDVVTNLMRALLDRAVNCLWGCTHPRTTFPITLCASVTMDGQPGTQFETYIVCLECGRHLAYDWNSMCVTRRPAAEVFQPAVAT